MRDALKEVSLVVAAVIAALALLVPAVGSAAAPEIEMVFVKGGCFQMGDTFGHSKSNEKPVHEVCVGDFSIGKYEVTQAQWQAVMGNNPSKFTGDRRPVDNVSWNDAQAFIAKLNQLTGSGYRLPTEAEWEYAARSRGRREKWAGTSDEAELGDYAWYDVNSDEKTHLVGTRRPNRLGLYDVSGNVWEWVQDRYEDTWYEESPKDNPQGPPTGNTRVLRGGSWYGFAESMRAVKRHWGNPTDGGRLGGVGFRLAAPSR